MSSDPEHKSPPSNQSQEDLENQEIEEKKPTSAHVIYRAISESADEELSRPAHALAFSALAAGLSMGFSLIAEALLRHHLPETAWRPLLTKFGYPVGFLIVILGRQQLFTENTLSPILTLLRDRHAHTLWRVIRLWTIVLLFNLVGTFLLAQALAHTPTFDASIQHEFKSLGEELLKPSIATAFCRSIFAGWLIALMVWLLPGAETGRIPIITILTYLVGLGHFNHIIAGAAEAFYLTATHNASYATITTHFLLPTLAGNILGGTTLVAALNFAQSSQSEKS